MRVRRAIGTIAVATLTAAGCTTGSGPPSGRSGTPGTTPGRGSGGASSSPSSNASLARPQSVRAVLVAKVKKPTALAIRAGDGALYIVGKLGKVWALRAGRVDPTPVLDLSGKLARGNERGLLGMAFSPTGEFAYVDFTDLNGDTNVVEYAWKDGRADLSTRRLVLLVRQPFLDHNGGNLAFGPDGYLYISLGDGGSDYSPRDPQGDPFRNGQNLGVLLGKLLRIAPRMPDGSLPPDGTRYSIPQDNPFVHRAGARPEIWAYGLRNPWRYSFDRETGDLWIGDVGAGTMEEIDIQPAGSRGGENYGWNALEGTIVYRDAPPDAVPPAYVYEHRDGACAVVGGYVYRGTAMPNLAGWYLFGDYCAGTVSALRIASGEQRAYVISDADIPQLSSFGQDQEGELYVLSLAKGVYKLAP